MAFPLLDDPTIQQRMVRFNPEQYQAMGAAGLIPERTELLEGVIVEKGRQSPQQVYFRSTLADALREFDQQGWLVRERQPISHGNSEPEPDISVVRGKLEDFCHAHPATAEWVAKVSDDGSGIAHLKRRIYAMAGVREYWIVLPEEQRLEAYSQPVGAEYRMEQIYVASDIVTSEVLPSGWIWRRSSRPERT